VDPITIGAFLASAGTSLLSGFLADDAADDTLSSNRLAFQAERSASTVRNMAIAAEAKAAREAGRIEWKAGKLDFNASMIEGRAVTAQAASDYFNVLIDAENTARAFEADATEGEFNARVAQQMARNSIQVADAEARDYRLRGNAAIESQAALQAGSGFMLEGSPMLVQDVLFGEVELGTARLRHAGEVEATRYENEAELFQFGSVVSTLNADTARAVGNINAGYVKQAGKIRLQAAFLNGDRALLGLESASLASRTAQTRADFQTIANKQALTASRIQIDASNKASKKQGDAAILGGVGDAFKTIASSGVFG
jgi:hypothetical protein